MSRKLATTVKDSAIPGKYKRIAEAYAAFANNDGSNIFAAQEKIGKKAGVSPDTIQRNTPDLIESGILKRGETHTCKIAACNKGSWHFSGVWGRSSKVYEIQIGNLQNAVSYLTAKCGLVNAAKCRKVKAANCGTTQALKETQANPDSSALTSGNEREKEGTSSRSRSTTSSPESKTENPDLVSDSSLLANQEQEQQQPQDQEQDWHGKAINLSEMWKQRTGSPFTPDEYGLVSSLIRQQGYSVVENVLQNTLFRRPRSAKMLWGKIRFKSFVDNWQLNYDACMAYYAEQSSKGNGMGIPPQKFDSRPYKSDQECKEDKEAFRSNCKTDDWKITPLDKAALYYEEEHVIAAVRFCLENEIKVTKDEFLKLVTEAAGIIKHEEVAQ